MNSWLKCIVVCFVGIQPASASSSARGPRVNGGTIGSNVDRQSSGEFHSKTNLYIRGLAPSTTDESLRKLCEKYALHILFCHSSGGHATLKMLCFPCSVWDRFQTSYPWRLMITCFMFMALFLPFPLSVILPVGCAFCGWQSVGYLIFSCRFLVSTRHVLWSNPVIFSTHSGSFNSLYALLIIKQVRYGYCWLVVAC